MIKIKEVLTKNDFKVFVKFPFKLYKDSKFWVPPITSEELKTLDKKNNPVFKNADAKFYLAYRGNKVVGRIGAMINWIEVKKLSKPKVRFGWYDVVDDFNLSKLLIEKVIEYGKENNLSFVEGPVGFSNLDKAGLLTYGFNELNTMITLYNFPYYEKHLKKLKFKIHAEWVEYEIKIDSFEESPEKIKKISEIIQKRYKLEVIHFKSTKQIIPYVDKMFKLLSQSYNQLQTFVPIQDYQINYYKKKYFKYLNPDFIKCIKDDKDELIGFIIAMPSFAKALKKANGSFFPLGFLHILKARYLYNDKASFYLMGIHPSYQNKGIPAIILNEVQKLLNSKGIKLIETNPELIENKAIQRLWKNYNHRIHKKRATFKLNF
ncbi:MAG: GNAT family N-acetyltransferase [Flavobacteriaceae bacterium]|nr:GNAT family N-acetyltransferase [Flavobacteriaceae bacterium]